MRSSTGRAPAPSRQRAELGAFDARRSIVEVFPLLKARAPRVHCLTNNVAQAFTANALLAAGAIPSMTIAPDEIAHFVRRAGALLVNLGTLDAERRAALPIALAAAAEASIPVVLDPVFVDASPPRLAVARRLIKDKPAIIRFNAIEFQSLSKFAANAHTVAEFADELGATVALTGSTDIVSDGRRTLRVGNGHPFMAQVTAMGCAGGALIAALLAACGDPFTATVTGLAAFGVAGEIAGATARGPGSFAVAIIDTLATLEAPALVASARIESMP